MVATASLEEVMLDAAKEVFETMVFMPLEKCASCEPETGDPAILATITFTGDLEGCFGISCDGRVAQAVAASMLCLEPGEPLGENEVADALGEIANMIMGGIKTRIQQETAGIEISIPCIVRGHQLRSRLGEGMSRITTPVTFGSAHQAELSLLYRGHGG